MSIVVARGWHYVAPRPTYAAMAILPPMVGPRAALRDLAAFTRQRSREQVIGAVSIYDLLFEERPGLTLRNWVEPVVHVSPQEKVAEALVRLRRERANLAVVTDAGGRALGIVTLKDLVEEITGELRDL